MQIISTKTSIIIIKYKSICYLQSDLLFNLLQKKKVEKIYKKKIGRKLYFN
jgi:hypothetical protein